jgi:hypothetical protein
VTGKGLVVAGSLLFKDYDFVNILNLNYIFVQSSKVNGVQVAVELGGEST